MTEFEEGNLPKDFSPELIDYMEKTSQKMEINYMKNGLSKEEEVELRKKSMDQIVFPEKPKSPGSIFLHEISSTFPLLLWIASSLSFLAYGLNPEEKSNLYLAVVVAIIIILLSGFFSYIQHEQSGEIMDSFKSFSNTILTSTRDSQ